MKNTFQDLNKAELEANEALKKAQQHIAEVKQQKEEQQQAEIQAKKDERNKLMEDSRKLLDEAAQEAKNGNLDRAMALREFAADSRRQADDIFIEGEQRIESEVVEDKLFGQGMRLSKIVLLLSGLSLILYLLCGYINHAVELGEKNISISIGAEWIHTIQTTEFWAMCWMFSFGMMYLAFRSISRFINPKEHPEHDLITKLFTECTPYQQVAISLGLLLSFVLSWCLIYLHNPVSNAG